MAYVVDEREAVELLRRYEIRVGEKPAEPGPDLILAGYEAEPDGRVVALHGGAHATRRRLPLDPPGAESMLAPFSSERSVAHDHKSRAMLAHLILKAARMYEETGINRFSLVVRVRDNAYLVHKATIWANRDPHFTPRLAPHAHDNPPRSYGYHPKREKRTFRE